MVSHINGDLLKVQKELNLDVICHQVNCQGVMGSGIAKQIRDTYPIVYDNYKKKCSRSALYTIMSPKCSNFIEPRQ